MSDLSLRDYNTSTQFRSQVRAQLTHLASLEHDAHAASTSSPPPLFRLVPKQRRDSRTPATKRVPTVPSPVPLVCVPICTTCGTPGCDYTECPQGRYVFDTPDLSRPLAPGEQLPTPATWKDLHRATLQSALRVVAQYYCAHHATPRYLAQARLIVSDTLTGPDDLSAETTSLLTRAISAVTTRLRVDPFCTTIPGLFNSLCECYHSPIFGVTLEQFKLRVTEQLQQCPSPR
jgi:hypothetical protein